MDYLIMGIAAVIIVILLFAIFKYNNKKNTQKTKSKILQQVKCPICDSSLFVGENIISKVYRPMNVPDQLCTISGCPHCFPKCEPGLKRICPVCHKEVDQNGNLTARLFNKNVGKKHVHVLGCNKCHTPRWD